LILSPNLSLAWPSLLDQVVPDIVCFASLGEPRALVADIAELQPWFANDR
jgi:hypothetical protein